MNGFRWAIAVLLVASLVGLAWGQVMPMDNQTPAGENVTPSVDENVTPTINVTMNQTLEGNATVANVTIDEVVSDGPGWLVIHNNLFGHLGGVIGFSQVDPGTNSNVTVTIDTHVAIDRLSAELHKDLGQEGVFEYPVIDGPQMADGQPVTANISVTAENFTVNNLTELAGNQTRLQDQNRTPDLIRNQTRDPTLM